MCEWLRAAYISGIGNRGGCNEVLRSGSWDVVASLEEDGAPGWAGRT
jgi:hypothetical protein